MHRLIIKRFIIIIIMVLFILSLLTDWVKADLVPDYTGAGPDWIDAEPIDEHSVLVTWADAPLAQGYRVYRAYTGNIAEVAANVHEYLDTGLSAGILYIYQVASLIDGQAYWANHPDEGAWTVNIPTEITSLDYYSVKVDGGHEYLKIDLYLAAAEDIYEYDVHYRIGDIGEYMPYSMTSDNEVPFVTALPILETRYWFKVRAYTEFYSVEFDNEYYVLAPFCTPVSITVPGYFKQLLKTPNLLESLQYISTPKPKIFFTVTPSPKPFKKFPELTTTKPLPLVTTTPKPFIPPNLQIKPIRP